MRDLKEAAEAGVGAHLQQELETESAEKKGWCQQPPNLRNWKFVIVRCRSLALTMGLQLVYDHGPVEEQQSRVQELQLHEDGDAKDDGKLAQTCSTHTAQVRLLSASRLPPKHASEWVSSYTFKFRQESCMRNMRTKK